MAMSFLVQDSEDYLSDLTVLATQVMNVGVLVTNNVFSLFHVPFPKIVPPLDVDVLDNERNAVLLGRSIKIGTTRLFGPWCCE